MQSCLDNNSYIFDDYFYVIMSSYKQVIKLYSSNKLLLNYFIKNKSRIEKYFYTPRIYIELKYAVDAWCNNSDKAIKIYGHISQWNTTYITDMNNLFYYKLHFNDNIEDWNTSNVTHMCWMFSDAFCYDKPLDKWDTSNVQCMTFMFYGAEVFNQCIDKWNVSKVTDMHNMFHNASLFNKPLNSWNVSNVQNMTNMFNGALNFNKNLMNWKFENNIVDCTNMFYIAN